MRIEYPTKSSFLEQCEKVIYQKMDELFDGTPIVARFSPKGYPGTVRVKIEKKNRKSFWTDWEYPDPTRFPQRIKAGAWALFRQKCFGEFLISHYRGTLTFRYLGSSVNPSSRESSP